LQIHIIYLFISLHLWMMSTTLNNCIFQGPYVKLWPNFKEPWEWFAWMTWLVHKFKAMYMDYQGLTLWWHLVKLRRTLNLACNQTKGNKFDNHISDLFTKLISHGQPIWESKGPQFPKWFFCKLQTTFAYLHNILNHSLSDDFKM
jgi:hypothetical protein